MVHAAMVHVTRVHTTMAHVTRVHVTMGHTTQIHVVTIRAIMIAVITTLDRMVASCPTESALSRQRFVAITAAVSLGARMAETIKAADRVPGLRGMGEIGPLA